MRRTIAVGAALLLLAGAWMALRGDTRPPGHPDAGPGADPSAEGAGSGRPSILLPGGAPPAVGDRTDDRGVDDDRAITLLDLADGGPAAGIRLRLDRGEEVESDEEGHVRIPGDQTPTLVEGSPWRLVHPLGEEAHEPVRYVYRMLTVHGRLVPMEGLDVDLTSFRPRVLLPVSLPPISVGTGSWLRRHGLQFDTKARVSKEGSFVVRIPCCANLRLTAQSSLQHVQVERVAIPVPALAADEVHVRMSVELSPLLLDGIVTTPSGAPIANARVTCHAVQRVHPSDLGVAGHRDPRHALTVAVLDRHTAFVTQISSEVTDQAGRFSQSVAPGDVLVVVHAPGHLASRERLGVLDTTDSRSLAITLEPVGETRRITVLNEGRVLADATMALTDITDWPFQTLMEIRVDPRGEISEEYLALGRDYWILVHWTESGGKNASTTGFVRWDGRDEIHLERLLKRIEDLQPR